MGAFKNKTKIIHLSENNETYFFSTDHCQETDKAFVPISLYFVTVNEIRKNCENCGYKEIDNPDPDFKP